MTPINSVEKTSEFWWGMDFMHLPCGMYQASDYGVFDSLAANNETNSIQDRHNYQWYGTKARGDRHDLMGYDNAGIQDSVIVYHHTDPWIMMMHRRKTALRMKAHYSYDAGLDQGNASLDIYQINADGSTGILVKSISGVVMDVGLTFTSDLFGLGNRSNGSKSTSIYNLNRYDNFYYSTVQASTHCELPDFIPEPGTIALLGLGTLLLRKRR
jgi:hypothetical protein